MHAEKTIVKVNASFAEGEALFSLLKKYGQYADNSFVFWDEFAFTTADLPETDALLIFNEPSGKIEISCDPAKRIAFMMEPGVKSLHPWMFSRLEKYAKVYSPLPNAPNVTASHGYLGWYFDRDWAFLSQLAVPEKTRAVSCIASDLKQLKGHQLRIEFVYKLREEMPGIDFFGKGTRFLPDKLDGLLPYRYSIAIENTSAPDYFTEKINDCFLSYTVPIYYGCTNLKKYFPERSFIQIDPQKPRESIHRIRGILANDDWNQRLGAVQEARQLVLNKYQPLAGAANILRDIPTSGQKQLTGLRPLPKSISRQAISFLKMITGAKAR